MLLVLCLCFMSNYATGESDMSKKEDRVISRQLKILNKPPIKTITTKYGDIINCNDIFKQPAFDHPPLKNRKIEFASIQPVEGKLYYGGHVIMGAYNPPVTPEQFSTSQMWIQNGPEEQLNSIEAAWAVYPKLFGDNITRIFGYWTADGYKSTGCFNIFCPGFVQVHPSITFGELLEPVSVYKGKKYSIPVEVYQARASGKWWLSVGGQVIGYWPKELFTHLAQNASIVRYGGIAGAVSGSPSPPMGNGHFPEYQDYDLAKAGFMREMKVFNEAGEIVYFDYTRALRKLDTKKETCYKLYYYSYSFSRIRGTL